MELKLPIVFLVLENGLLVAKPFSEEGVVCLESEISPLIQNVTSELRRTMEAQPLYEIHRHASQGFTQISHVTLDWEPSVRQIEWVQTVPLRFPVVLFHQKDLPPHFAWVPSLDIGVFVSGPGDMLEKIRKHILWTLRRTGQGASLKELDQIQRCQEIRLETVSVALNLKSPRALAIETQQDLSEELSDGNGKPDSVLGVVATELIPRHMEPTFEMEPALARLVETLAGRFPRSVLLIGPSGCGKTALVHEIARRKAGLGLDSQAIWATSGSRLIAGMSGFGMWQERCLKLLRECSKTRAILHLGNLVELVGVGKGGSDKQGVSAFLRPFLDRGDLLGIVECTPEQYVLLEREEANLLQVFTPIRMPELSSDTRRKVLRQYVDFHHPQISMSDEVLDHLNRIHERYASYSAFPGRPLRFLRNLVRDALIRSERAISVGMVTELFSRETGLPLFVLDDSIPLDLLQARRWFEERVMGQEESVRVVVDLLAMIKTRLSRPRKPLASLFFLGPTGVGKTEMAKSLAEYLFRDPRRMVRFDLSQFSDPWSVQRLIGGVLGSEGLLTAKIREQPFCVLLLDEFEKAHPSLFDLMLQVLGEGRLTDASGRVADFSNVVVVMTSNLGAEGSFRGEMGFNASESEARRLQQYFLSEVKKFFRPELFNRLDGVVPFNGLTLNVAESVTRRELNSILRREGISGRRLECEIDDQVSVELTRIGYHPRYGARPLKRIIENRVLLPLAEALNGYTTTSPLIAQIRWVQGSVEVKVRTQPPPDKPTAEQMVQLRTLADRITALRRDLQALKESSPVWELENRIYLLEGLKSRQARQKFASPEDQTRLKHLPRLKEVLSRLEELESKVEALEETLLLNLLENPGSPAPEPRQAECNEYFREWNHLREWIFWFSFPQPDSITLGLFSVNSDFLFSLAQAYYQTARSRSFTVQVHELTPHLGSREKDPKRRVIAKPDHFFGAPKEGVIGILLEIHGFLAFPTFSLEDGAHEWKKNKATDLCWIVTSSQKAEQMAIPTHIERRGKLPQKQRRRVYEVGADRIQDSQLGQRSWTSDPLQALPLLIQAQYDSLLTQYFKTLQ